MKKLLLLLLTLCIALSASSQDFKKYFKFATFYGAVSGGTSISDVDVYSVANGLETQTVKTPFDYNVAFGVRKIARFGYESGHEKTRRCGVLRSKSFYKICS